MSYFVNKYIKMKHVREIFIELMKAINISMIFNQYVAHNIILFIIGLTGFIIGNNNHDLIRLWFCTVMTFLLVLRIIEYFKRDFHHYLIEFCYYVNWLTILFVSLNLDIRYIYPLIHGPLVIYAIVSKDAIVPMSLTKTTSYAIHAFASIMTRRLYWYSHLVNNSYDSYLFWFTCSFGIYLCWYIPYCYYVMKNNTQHACMIKWYNGKDNNWEPAFIDRLFYLLRHMFGITIGIIIGTFMMYHEYINISLIVLQLLTGMYYGNKYYKYKHKE
uniref:Glycerophosphocholine acyltransferase 1 n=1 Tax=viral metagenome TaxID=1070528 RepID=A0A6C0EBC3_9ZZZZ